MLFKTALLFGFAASVFAAPEAHVEARGLAADNGANRMVRMARSQAGVHEDFAKRAIADSHAARERRSGAARMNKRDFSDEVKRDLNDNEKRDELPLLQGLRALLHQLYPGLNQAVVGVENTATGAVTGLDGILKRDLTGGELQLFAGLNSLLHKVYPGLNNAGVSAEQLVSDLVAGLDKTLKKRGDETAAPVNEKRDMNPLLVGLNWDILRPLFHNLNGVVVNTEQAVSGAVSGLDDILKKRATGDIPPNTVNADVQLEQLLRNLLGGRGLLYNLLRGIGLNQ
ncbi:hypothetical protein DMC30DRAFT_159940 [Rhodotorula diobovata]|uniref:Proteophosphoglycan ppg4 n=1 Tax=Rhodotorula diobovata TaxID=5288 RepID=A0A5C5FZE8_9BASI|nr:hypothetical protein DMC30DRAFT_159940 [Rhodotorula diobovata]